MVTLLDLTAGKGIPLPVAHVIPATLRLISAGQEERRAVDAEPVVLQEGIVRTELQPGVDAELVAQDKGIPI